MNKTFKEQLIKITASSVDHNVNNANAHSRRGKSRSILVSTEQIKCGLKKIKSESELQEWLNQNAHILGLVINKENRNSSKKRDACFRSFSLNEIYQLFQKKIITTDDISPKLLPSLFKANSIAIDIESNGSEIYQLGYATSCETKLFDNTRNDSLNAITETEKAANAKSHWLIGHNIVAWDLSVLRGVKNNCFSEKIIWDTLIISWMLSPWKKSHALVNKEEAHRADSDAKAALQLFYQQIDELPTDDVLELAGNVLAPVEFLFRNDNILDKYIEYPEIPQYLKKDSENDQLIILPHARLDECAWCQKIAYSWPVHHRNEEDSLIDLTALERLAVKDRDIFIRALTVVVRDAKRNNVQVLLRMIPRWLRDKIIEKLREGKCLVNNHSTIANHINVSTYYAHRGVDDQSLMQLLSSTTNKCLFWKEGQFDLQIEPVSIDNHDVTKVLGIDKPPAYALIPLRKEEICCKFVSEKALKTRQIWLTYDPANGKIASASCWHLRQQICFPTQQDTDANSDESFNNQDKPVAIFPAWTAAPNGKNKYFNDFVPPTSGSRVQYWGDALSRLLSLENTENFKGVYVLLVSHLHEKDIITTALSDYGVTIPFENSPLRQLERLRRNSKHFAVDTFECANQWLTASETMNYEIQFVIESLPVEEWWICLNATTEITCSETDKEDESEETEDDDSDVNQAIELKPLNIAKQADKNQSDQIMPVMFTRDTVQSCIERFLKPWLSRVTHGQTPINPPIILDCRFDQINFNKSAHFARHDFVMKPFVPSQKEQLLRYLRDSMGDIERQDAPTDYETYRKFFAKHWSDKDRNIEDFKAETQRPAIEAIIPNDSDVLVRLPTGEGKSVLFQVPALVRGLKTQKLTIVVTPLRALMADQVHSLWSMGFFQSVDYLSGDRDQWINSEVYQGIIDNRIKLLYIAPERFRIPRFIEALSRRLENDQSFEYVVIDEAHCISQWGFEFRPDYLYAIKELRKLCRTAEHYSHFLFFSATVTDATLKAIEEEAGITAGDNFKIKPEKMPHPIQPFIRLHSEDVKSKLYGADITSSRRGFIEKKILDTDLGKSALIIFVTRKRHAENLCNLLEQSVKDGTLLHHTRIRYFHADIPSLERQEIYEAYKKGEVNVLICTKAFGMGMDISHIHKCIHLAPPAYLEDYLQEVGRTGRGAKERNEAGLAFVDCDLLYDKSDFETNNKKIMESRIGFPALESLWNKLTNEAKKYAHDNLNICVIPKNKYDNLDENMLRLSLFWLERMERLEIIGSVNGLLKVRLNKENLQRLAKGNDNVNIVANALLMLYEPPAEQQDIKKGSSD